MVGAVEKLVYLIWDRPSIDGAALRTQYLDEVAPALLDLGPRQLSMHLDDDEAPIPGPAPAPGHELPVRAAVSLFVNAHDRRGPYEEVLAGLGERRAGYLVSEAVWSEYGENGRRGPRDWPDGERSPGITTFSLVHRNPAFDERTFREFWHGHQSPMSEAVQPRWRYVRNTVVHPVTPGAPPVDGIVHESWPSIELVEDSVAFHNDDPENITVMLDSVMQLFDIARLRSFALSEYLLKS
jgi:hypothetical protein